MEIKLKAIGVVHTGATEAEIRGEHRDLNGELEIYPEFEPALEGIDGCSHLFVIFYFHKLRMEQMGHLQVKPKRLVKKGFKNWKS